jgi:hypothetical protein
MRPRLRPPTSSKSSRDRRRARPRTLVDTVGSLCDGSPVLDSETSSPARCMHARVPHPCGFSQGWESDEPAPDLPSEVTRQRNAAEGSAVAFHRRRKSATHPVVPFPSYSSLQGPARWEPREQRELFLEYAGRRTRFCPLRCNPKSPSEGTHVNSSGQRRKNRTRPVGCGRSPRSNRRRPWSQKIRRPLGPPHSARSIPSTASVLPPGPNRHCGAPSGVLPKPRAGAVVPPKRLHAKHSGSHPRCDNPVAIPIQDADAQDVSRQWGPVARCEPRPARTRP